MYDDNQKKHSFHVSMNEFLNVAKLDIVPMGATQICCLCHDCKNLKMYERKYGDIHMNLLRWCFMVVYTWWTSHNEEEEVVGDEGAGHGEPEAKGMDYEDTGHEVAKAADTRDTGGNLAVMVQDPHVQRQVVKETNNDIAAHIEDAKLEILVKDSKTPLYPGCMPECTSLSVMLELLRLKVVHHSMDTSLDEILEYLAKVMPERNVLPHSCDEARKVVCPLELELKRCHACLNGYIICWNQYEKLTNCP